MLTCLALCFHHKRFISRRKRFCFQSGLNVLIGPNGSGKSSLLKAIHRCKDCDRQEGAPTTYHYFNSEEMNPHKTHRYFKGFAGSVIRARSLFSSHGETLRDVLKSYRPQRGDCFLLDEPEVGHDLSWILKIRRGLDELARSGCQVIVASHHPVFWAKASVIELKRGYLQRSCKLMHRVTACQLPRKQKTAK
ncbi:MAG TPA: AAA family ATPase [Candidatus Omnitrophota bacterium]|nr:AAA family ATPase [Candidatus Omnitrophota bacterium]